MPSFSRSRSCRKIFEGDSLTRVLRLDSEDEVATRPGNVGVVTNQRGVTFQNI